MRGGTIDGSAAVDIGDEGGRQPVQPEGGLICVIRASLAMFVWGEDEGGRPISIFDG